MTIAQRLALALLLLTGIQLGQPAAALPLPASGEAVHIKIEGALDLGTLALVRRAIRTAQAGTSQRMVVEIDTPGGQIDLMWQIAKALDEAAKSGVTVAAWVNDEALSAGVLVAISCDKVYTRRIASIGSAQPVQMVPTGMVAVPEKAASVFRSQVRAWAESHGRSPALAVAMVDPEAEVRRVWLDGEERYITGTEWDDLTERNAAVELIGTIARRGELLNFTGPEAVEHGFADGLAESLDEVLLKLGVAAVLLVSGCATFRRESDLDAALGNLNQVLAELEPDAKRARVVSIAERIETRARELVAEHRNFVDRFDQLLGEHDVPEAQLTEMIDAHSVAG